MATVKNLTYSQISGALSDNGVVLGRGYSGHDIGKNNPALQGVHNVGPIPKGTYSINGPPYDTATHGPYVMRLLPMPGTNTLGRSGFLIHGDNATGTASEGCIIMSRLVRQKIWESGYRQLIVI
jgi:hypothetical protein